jgi:hypothetical protein
MSNKMYWRIKGEIEALNTEIAEREKIPDEVQYTRKGFVLQKYTLDELKKFRDDRVKILDYLFIRLSPTW